MAAPYPKMAVGGRPSTASNLGSTVGRANLFSAKVGTVFQFRSIVAGTGAGVSLGGGEITLTAPGTNVTLANDPSTVGVTLVDDGAGPILATKGLTAGTAVALTAGATDVTIAASPVGESNTASNLGSGAGLFSAKVGVDLRFRSLVGGGAISAVADSPSAGNLLLTSAGFGGVLGFPWIVKYVVPSGTMGGSGSGLNPYIRLINNLTGNSSTDVQLAVAPAGSNQLRVVTGSYWIFGFVPSWGQGRNACWLHNVTTGAIAVNGTNDLNQIVGGTTSRTMTSSEIAGYFTVAAAVEVFELHQWREDTSGGTVSGGLAASVPGVDEVYIGLGIFRVA